jgi:hypothetical protein
MLFQLTAWVHWFIIEAQGDFPGWPLPQLDESDKPYWLRSDQWQSVLKARAELTASVEPITAETLGYQTLVSQTGRNWVTFAPSGELLPDEYQGFDFDSPIRKAFLRFIGRINAAVGRPNDLFPSAIEASGAEIRAARLDGASLFRASLFRASLFRASLDGASLDGASLSDARFLSPEQIRAVSSLNAETRLPEGAEFEAVKVEILKRLAEEREADGDDNDEQEPV